MTTYEVSPPVRGNRWAIGAAFVLGLLFLGLGAPLMVQGNGGVEAAQAEQQVEPRPNG